MTKKILSYYLKRIGRYFEKNTKSRLIVAGLMIGAILFLSFGIYYLTREGLQSTQTGEDPFMVEAIPLYIYQLFFLITGFLIFVSSSIFGLFNFFKDEADSWIMASSNFESLSWVKFLRALIDSSWPIIVLALPLLLAVQSVFSFPAWYFLVSLITVLLFSFFVSGFAIVVMLAISILLKIIKVNDFKVLAGFIGFICLMLGVSIWIRVVSVDTSILFQVEEVVDPTLLALKENFSIFPSHLPAMTIFSGQTNSLNLGLRFAGIVLASFGIMILVFKSLKSNFLSIWQTFQEGSFEAKTKTSKVKRFSAKAPNSREGVIFKKEALVNMRSPKNLFWFAFLMILMFAQVGVINLLEEYLILGANRQESLAGPTPSLQIGIILFFISALVLRFVFPSLSQEGDTSWILGSSPIDFRKIFKVKSLFYTGILGLISLAALSFYIIPLSVPLEVALISIVIVLTGVVTLTRVGSSMGAIFINFKTNDPQKLSTSPAGIGFILISLIYSALGAYSAYELFLRENYYLIIAFIILSVILYQLSNIKALKTLKRIEFL